MEILRKILPCRFEGNLCYEKENNPLSCRDYEKYRPKLSLPKITPVVMNLSNYLAFIEND